MFRWLLGRAGEHDFGPKVVMVQMRSDPGVGVYYERARVRRLGDRFFLAGEPADFYHGRRGENPYRGAVFWVPLAEVVEIREHDSLEAAATAHAEHMEAIGGLAREGDI